MRSTDGAPPLVQPAEASGPARLSFANLVEIHVLAGLRRDRGIPMARIRETLAWLEAALGVARPLASRDLSTDGIDVLVEHAGTLVAASAGGQLAWRPRVGQHLSRVVWDEGGAVRLFPYTRTRDARDERRSILVDPHVCFGRPVFVGTCVPVREVVERWLAGDPIAEIADDFALSPSLVEEGLRFERQST